MAIENRLWGQRRIQAELARLGFRVSARSIGKYMRRPWDGEPSAGWRSLLKQHASAMWACDFLCVQTIFFQTRYVLFVVNHASREVLRVGTTRHPSAEWASRQIVECCGWDREPPRFLIHDRDGRYGVVFDQRMKNLGITQIRTPFRSYGVAARSWHYRRLSNRHRCPMTQRTCREDLSRSLAAFDQANTLLAVVEMGSASWRVAGMIPGVARQPKKKLDPDPEALLRLLARWRAEAVKAGRPIVRTTLAFEAMASGSRGGLP